MILNGDGLADALYYFDNDAPYRKDDFYKAISNDQLNQHKWWKSEFSKLPFSRDGFSINILAGGYGIYNIPMAIEVGARDIRLYDFDKEVCDVNWRLMSKLPEGITFTQECLDVVFDRKYINKNVDVVLNTSCEMMYDFAKCKSEYDDGTIFILQGTNRPKKGNINVHKSVHHFIESTGVETVHYMGTTNEDKYERYMVIGA